MTHIDSPTPTLPSRRSALARTLTVAATLGIAAAATLGAGSPGTATAAGSVTGEACEVGEGVTVVVDFTDRPGGVVVGCAPGEQPSGFAALAAAGFTTGFEGGPNMLCTVNGQPTEGYPYCWTTGGFWSYWKKTRGGTWGFSPVGGSAGPVAVDAVEGWSWAPGFKSNAPGVTRRRPRRRPPRPPPRPPPPPPPRPRLRLLLLSRPPPPPPPPPHLALAARSPARCRPARRRPAPPAVPGWAGPARCETVHCPAPDQIRRFP